MKMLACIALGAITLVAGCAATPTANTSPAASATGPAMYCWKGRFNESGGKLSCNWEASRDAACESGSFQAVEASRYSEPQPAGMCRNGQWLVMVQAK